MRDEISNNYDTIDEKRRLLLSIAYGKEPVSDDVISIISEMAETSVNKDGAILSAFDQLYALKIRSDVEELLNKLLVIFKANRFLSRPLKTRPLRRAKPLKNSLRLTPDGSSTTESTGA